MQIRMLNLVTDADVKVEALATIVAAVQTFPLMGIDFLPLLLFHLQQSALSCCPYCNDPLFPFISVSKHCLD